MSARYVIILKKNSKKEGEQHESSKNILTVYGREDGNVGEAGRVLADFIRDLNEEKNEKTFYSSLEKVTIVKRNDEISYPEDFKAILKTQENGPSFRVLYPELFHKGVYILEMLMYGKIANAQNRIPEQGCYMESSQRKQYLNLEMELENFRKNMGEEKFADENDVRFLYDDSGLENNPDLEWIYTVDLSLKKICIQMSICSHNKSWIYFICTFDEFISISMAALEKSFSIFATSHATLKLPDEIIEATTTKIVKKRTANDLYEYDEVETNPSKRFSFIK